VVPALVGEQENTRLQNQGFKLRLAFILCNLGHMTYLVCLISPICKIAVLDP
jgi:hypothetical protein